MTGFIAVLGLAPTASFECRMCAVMGAVACFPLRRVPWPCSGDLLPGPIEFFLEPVLIEKVALAAGEEDGQSSDWIWELWRACACRRFGWGALLG